MNTKNGTVQVDTVKKGFCSVGQHDVFEGFGKLVVFHTPNGGLTVCDDCAASLAKLTAKKPEVEHGRG